MNPHSPINLIRSVNRDGQILVPGFSPSPEVHFGIPGPSRRPPPSRVPQLTGRCSSRRRVTAFLGASRTQVLPPEPDQFSRSSFSGPVTFRLRSSGGGIGYPLRGRQLPPLLPDIRCLEGRKRFLPPRPLSPALRTPGSPLRRRPPPPSRLDRRVPSTKQPGPPPPRTLPVEPNPLRDPSSGPGRSTAQRRATA